MATISQFKQDWAEVYDGYDEREVGIGLSSPNIYASDEYAKKKTQELLIGGMAEIIYSGFDHDMNPLVLSMAYEPNYNTILALNLNYVPQNHRQAIIKFIFDSNRTRIKNNEPIIIDYHALKRSVPSVQGIVRRYKNVGIRVVGNVPLVEWPKAITRQSRWTQMYKRAM